jgi:hypothetical protein
MRKGKDAHINFPLPLYEQLRKLAAINRRPINTEIVIAVESHLTLNKPTLLLAARKARK